MHLVSRVSGFLSISCLAFAAPDKARLDVHPPAAKSSAWLEQKTISNGTWVATLLEGAFFTLGTDRGVSSTAFDDDNTLSYGHPYAKTSYPIIKVGGRWSKPADAAGATLKSLSRSGNQLSVEYSLGGGLEFRFRIVAGDSQPNRMALICEFMNGSTLPVEAQTGLVFDPGLGWNGQDAWAHVEGMPITKESISNPASIGLWERASGRKGVGLSLSWQAGSSIATYFGNWPRVGTDDGATVDVSAGAALFDLAVKTVFSPVTVPAGGTSVNRIEASLPVPEPGTAFLRWDCPRQFTSESGLLFPQDFPSTLKVFNGGTTERTYTVRLTPPYELLPDTATLSLTAKAGGWGFGSRTLHVRENYQADLILPVSAQVLSGPDPVDDLSFNIFHPKSPFSDTGLVVSIDSSFTGADGKVNLSFSARRTANGQSLFNLGKENIFLTENGSKVQDFTVGKDTSGGRSQLDIVFILDVTGSMSEEIAGVKNNIVQFGDDLARKGIDFQLGMVTFLDAIESIFPMTSDVQAFKANVGAQFAHGGNDEPENSLDALASGAGMQFRDKAKVIFIWITDASYHQADNVTSKTAGKVLETLLSRDIQVFCIGTPNYNAAFYQPIHGPTGGEFYDINGNFQDILLDISGTQYARQLLLTFKPAGGSAGGEIVLEVHHSGLGGKDSLRLPGFPSPKYGGEERVLQINCPGIPCDLPAGLARNIRGRLEIFDLRGTRLHSEELDLTLPAGRRILAGRQGPGLEKAGIYLFSITGRNSMGIPTAERGRMLLMGRN